MSYRLANLNAVIAEQRQRTASLSVNVEAGPEPATTQFRTSELSVYIAGEQTISVVLDVLTDLGVAAKLDVLVSGTHTQLANLQVYVKSAQLKLGASALYNPDGDEVESVLYVEDGSVLHPEFVEDMTATLLYRSKHVLGSTSFNGEHGAADGTIVNIWTHPAHTEDLSVRYKGTVLNVGAVDFTVPVSAESSVEDDIPLSKNLLPGVDIEKPRTEPSTFATQVQHLDAAPEEIETLHESVVLTLLKLNLLSRYEYLEIGTGPVDYAGGGNRLLQSLEDSNVFVLQAKNTLPPTIGAHTHVEDAETNLLGNSNFLTPTSTSDAVPLGYIVTSASSVTVLPTVSSDASSGIGLLGLRVFGSGKYTGPKKMTFAYGSAVAATPADPWTFSVLARTKMAHADVLVKDLRLIMSFRSAVDVEISQQVALFDPATLAGDNFVLLQNTILAPPVGTTFIRVSLEMESFEESDDLTLTLAAPMLAANSSATTRVVDSTAPTTRSADVLRIPQEPNIEFRIGTVIAIFAPAYDGEPVADACLFDTRDASALNGFAVFHQTNGLVRFMIAGPSSTKTLTTTLPFSFQPGIFQEISVSWSNSFMEIRVNSEVKATDSTAVVLPQAFSQWIYLMQTSTGTNRLEGELASFEIRRDKQS